jgi:hypothetical protein
MVDFVLQGLGEQPRRRRIREVLAVAVEGLDGDALRSGEADPRTRDRQAALVEVTSRWI